MNASDISILTNIVLSSLSVLLVIISVITVMVTLRQNNKMLESSTRAYLVIYIDSIVTHEHIVFLVLKNFGNSAATLKSIESTCDLAKIARYPKYVPLQKLENVTIAPNQILKYPIKSNPEEIGIDILDFKISYSCNSKEYEDNFSLPLCYLSGIVHHRSCKTSENHTPEASLYNMEHTFSEIAERML